MTDMSSSGREGYILEYHQVGRFIKVSAIDTISLTEVSIMGDPKTSKKVLARIAINKLERRLEKEQK